ncbi:MAG TPA: hypothetical protein VNY32_01840 [Candidatus Acidoferrales bacterium]|nr:hypothetical protein [Candidatus Acidoferrales bacterium]
MLKLNGSEPTHQEKYYHKRQRATIRGSVDVSYAEGTARVSGEGALDPAALYGAVHAAGYGVALEKSARAGGLPQSRRGETPEGPSRRDEDEIEWRHQSESQRANAGLVRDPCLRFRQAPFR